MSASLSTFVNPQGETRYLYSEEMDRDTAMSREIWDAYSSDPSDSDDKWRFGSLRTYDATIAQFRAGTATKTARRDFERFRESLSVPVSPVSIKRRRVYGFTGEAPNIDRYLSGNPEVWESRKRLHRTARRIITLAMNLAHNCGEHESAFAETSARATAVSDVLETAGYSVRVLGLMHTAMERSDNPELRTSTNPDLAGLPNCVTSIAVLLKEAGEPLDTQRLLSWGVPGGLRSQGFAHWYRLLRWEQRSGLGQARADGFEQAARQAYGAIPVFDLEGAIAEATK